MEEGRVQLAVEEEAALLVPTEGRAVAAVVAGEGCEVPGVLSGNELGRKIIAMHPIGITWLPWARKTGTMTHGCVF